jgi:dTDP-4-amino-4,6-dideoxygalactose transaminase
MGGTEQKHVQNAFDTNWIAPVGPHINKFEEDLAFYTSTGHAAVLSSGTAALHLALKILGVGEGDIVLTQSFTFAGSAFPITYLGARPVFIDSEKDTWNLDPNVLEDTLKRIITRPERSRRASKHQRPKAIIPVHLYGMPAKMAEISAIANKYDIPIIEDAAEALGSKYNGEQCGSLGDMGILSFNGNKIITTSGGGALLSDNEAYIEKAKFLATQARDAAPHYQHTEVGYNYRMGNINAAIGLGQMEVLDQRVQRKREIWQYYYTELKDLFRFQNWQDSDEHISSTINAQEEANKAIGRDTPLGAGGSDGHNHHTNQPPHQPTNQPPHYFSNRWLTTILTESYEQREAIRLALEQENIESRPLWKPMHLQPVFKGAQYFGGKVAEDMFNRGLCLPSGTAMTEGDLERVVKIIRGILNR